MIETRQQPASIYIFLITEQNIAITAPMKGHAIKAFSLEEAAQIVQTSNPNKNLRLLSYSPLDDFVKGCDIKLQATSTEVSTMKKREIYNGLIGDVEKTGETIFTNEEKLIFNKALEKLKNL